MAERELTTAEIKGRCQAYLRSCQGVLNSAERSGMVSYAAERLIAAADFASELGLITKEEGRALEEEARKIWKEKLKEKKVK